MVDIVSLIIAIICGTGMLLYRREVKHLRYQLEIVRNLLKFRRRR